MISTGLADIRRRLEQHGKPARKPRQEREHCEQVALFEWAALAAKTRPALHMLYAIPNGGHRSKATAGKLRAEGVKAGVPDIHLPVPVGRNCGLWIEMKAGRNGVTPEQSDWIDALSAVGHACYVAYSWQAARDLILAYLDGAPRDGWCIGNAELRRG